MDNQSQWTKFMRLRLRKSKMTFPLCTLHSAINRIFFSFWKTTLEKWWTCGTLSLFLMTAGLEMFPHIQLHLFPLHNYWQAAKRCLKSAVMANIAHNQLVSFQRTRRADTFSSASWIPSIDCDYILCLLWCQERGSKHETAFWSHLASLVCTSLNVVTQNWKPMNTLSN